MQLGMKTLIFCIAFVLTSLAVTAKAEDQDSAPVRQAVIRVTIEKKTFKQDQDGPPRFERTLVCNQETYINVYQSPFDKLVIYPGELKLVQCDGELFGEKVSVTVGGYINLYQDLIDATPIPMKATALVLSWGDLNRELPKLAHPSASEAWTHFRDVLSPIATGKIVDSVPQPPEPREFFMATVILIDKP